MSLRANAEKRIFFCLLLSRLAFFLVRKALGIAQNFEG